MHKKNLIFTLGSFVLFLSLAGMPPFSGFIGKFLVFVELLNQQLFFIVSLIAMVSSMSILYYINLIYIGFFKAIGNYNFNKLSLIIKRTEARNFYRLFLFHFFLLGLTAILLNTHFLLPFIFKGALLAF
jgi:NADH:ubiquinone oxidoreductase subunit 2 (subunit N)